MFVSTRSHAAPVSATRALLSGLAPDGGLYVPVEFPRLPVGLLSRRELSYAELATEVLALFFPGLARADLAAAAERSAELFPSDPAPLVSAGGLHVLELFHGPTLAFKDFALSVMGDLLRLSAEAEGDRRGRLVLVATSGDTGKAALAGFADRPRVRVLVFFPSEGVSEIQRLQLATHDASGACIVAVRGTFDDAQRGVKKLFADRGLASWLSGFDLILGSANSINIGRLLPQIVYYGWAWRSAFKAGLVSEGAPLDFVVPSGNFGDALAGAWARRIGVPVGRITAATNRNRVLADFFETGCYDRNRDFYPTTSPSMDILAASNLERLLFELAGRDQDRVAALMAEFQDVGRVELDADERAALAASGFGGGSADEGEAAAEIGRVFREAGYLMDTHTGVAAAVARKKGAGAGNGSATGVPEVILSTASPFKFPGAVARAIGLEAAGGEIGIASALASAAGLELPPAVDGLRGKPVLHREVVDPSGMEGALRAFVEGARS